MKIDIVLDIHYNKISCTGNGNVNFQWKFNSKSELDNFQCSPSGIPFQLNFDGIIIAQGIKVPFLSENENLKKAYDLSVILEKDTCLKSIDFHFVLANIDTFERADNNRNIIVLLNAVDSTYTVNFSHEIIPFKE